MEIERITIYAGGVVGGGIRFRKALLDYVGP